MDLFGPLTRPTTGFHSVLVIVDGYKKLTKVVPLQRIDSYMVAVDFAENWVFKYGVQGTILSDKGSLLSSKKFQGM